MLEEDAARWNEHRKDLGSARAMAEEIFSLPYSW